ncbi:EamA family transporter [Leeia sp. TBRC 13508]|uniref:EamA family transporter n=1 Tax=Leeia speluncae TaxID=2884804 RepID=A0ABS8D9C0_9NEIS|nr:EamA family transporter [Leeia speluncae]MCB6184203.1 EamA family transporter [Leeia speluncae]
MTNSTKKALLPLLAMLCCVTFLGAGTSWAKMSLFPAVGAAGTSALRVGISSLCLMAFWRPWRWKMPKEMIKPLILYGLSLGLMNLFFYLSIQSIPFGVALAIEFIGPLGVAILLSRKWVDFLWVCLAIVGLAMLIPIKTDQAALDKVGVIFALTAAFFWAVYIVFGKRISELHHGQSVPFGMLLAALVVVPVGFAQAGTALFSPNILLVAVCVAIISSALPISLEMLALQRVPAKTYGILVSMEPAVAALLAQVILHEHLTTSQWLAIGFIILASVGGALTSKSNTLQEANA